MAISASCTVWEVLQWMKDQKRAGRWYTRPTTLAKALSITRAEAEMALWILRLWKQAGCRRDGRWYLEKEEQQCK